VAVDDQAHAGTFVVTGEGLGLVAAVGKSTRLASIAQLAQRPKRRPTPLARELHRLVRTIASIAVGVGIAFLLVTIVVGLPVSDAVVFAIGVTVALVPEGLLPTVTLSLAFGAQRMAERNALVRHLESVETLGSTTYICTDKTGTLTENEMAAVEIWTPAGSATIRGEGYGPNAEVTAPPDGLPAIRNVALAAARSSLGTVVEHDGRWIPQGDPMEAALRALACRLGADVNADETANPVQQIFPFSMERRRMSVLAGNRLLVKGAPESTLPRCGEDARAWAALEEMTGRGLRVLAIADREVDEGESAREAPDWETDLRLLGLVGLHDPPRPGVADVIASCRASGIRIAMLTGDHPGTARAIADQLGLLGAESIVIEGKDLPQDEAQLGALLDRDGVVVSRVAPEDKLRITLALQARGHVVAMTGDGVNDAPALRQADIGIAMGRSGTDVAREVADLVLLDDNFATIVEAVRQGRATFSNIRRFLTYHLTDNVAELTPFVVWAISAGQIPLALGIIQILFLDIGTDLLPATALGAEPPTEAALQRQPETRHLLDRRLLTRVFGVLGPVEAAMEMAAFFMTFLAAGWRPGDSFPEGQVLLSASGAAFAAVVIGQSANAFACRSTTRWPGALGWTNNRLLIGAVAVSLLLMLVFLYVPPIAGLLEHAAPSIAGFAVALLTAPAVLLVDALQKRRAASRAPDELGKD
jgi:magnesium-transporting ATPase (P-type)